MVEKYNKYCTYRRKSSSSLKNTIKPSFEDQSNNNVVNLQAYLNENQLQNCLNNKIQQKNTYFVISAQLFEVKRSEADKKRR